MKVKQTIIKEGDYKAFEYKGFKCRIIRWGKIREHNNIHLCGYVLTKNKVSEEDAAELNVHGGITYNEDDLLCQPEKGQWIGFDCGHCFDIVYLHAIHEKQVYRTMKYVEDELKSLVEQIIKLGK